MRMAVLVVLAVLGVISTSMASPVEGWSRQKDIMQAISNHYNMAADVQQSECEELGYYGGGGGTAFSDPCSTSTRLISVTIGVGLVHNCSKCIRYLKTTSSNSQTASHGTRSGSSLYTIDLTDYSLIGLAVRTGAFLDQMTLIATHSTTGDITVFGPYGNSAGSSGITFGDIQAFYGRSGGGIDRIGAKGKLFE